jgi:hypothetical protein
VFKKLKKSEVPKRKRRSVARIEATKEWALMKAELDKGLKPDEAVEIILNTDDKKKYKMKSRRAAARFIKKYIEEKKLPYKVKSFNRDGSDFFIVERPAGNRGTR